MYQEAQLNISYEELRSIVLEMMKQMPSGQVNTLRMAVASTAVRMGLIPAPSQEGTRIMSQGCSGNLALAAGHRGIPPVIVSVMAVAAVPPTIVTGARGLRIAQRIGL